MAAYKDKRTGRWRYRKWVKHPNGVRERIWGTPATNTKSAAEHAERLHIERVNHPERVQASSTAAPIAKGKTIREHAKTFESHLPESKPSQKRNKANILETHLLPIFGDKTIEELTQPDIDAFTGSELKRGMAVKTVNNRLAVLSSLIKYVTKEKSKLKFKIKGRPGRVHAVPSTDVEKLIAACDDDRYLAIVLLACEAGLRAGEIRGLQWGDIRDGQITIRRALDNETDEVIPPKSKESVRDVPASPRILAALAKLKRRGIWVVSRLDGEILGYSGMLEKLHEIYTRAEVTPPPMPLHCIRHTFGTVMAKQVPLGVLQKLMGHEEISTTMRYIDVDEDQKRDAIALVFGQQVGNRSAAN